MNAELAPFFATPRPTEPAAATFQTTPNVFSSSLTAGKQQGRTEETSRSGSRGLGRQNSQPIAAPSGDPAPASLGAQDSRAQVSRAQESRAQDSRAQVSRAPVSKDPAQPNSRVQDSRVQVPKRREEEEEKAGAEDNTIDDRRSKTGKKDGGKKQKTGKRSKKGKHGGAKKQKSGSAAAPLSPGCFRICDSLIYEVYTLLGGNICQCTD